MEKAMVLAISKDAQFVWTRTARGEDRWVERLFTREIDAWGNVEWSNQHITSYLTQERVEDFAKMLADVGFKITEAPYPTI